MNAPEKAMVGCAIGLGLVAAFASPALCIVTAADSGAAVQPPAHRYFHRRIDKLTVLGPMVRTHGQWRPPASAWSDPDSADFSAIDDGSGFAVLPDATSTTKLTHSSR